MVSLLMLLLLVQAPAEWPAAAAGQDAEAREQLAADWDYSDERHRTLILMSIRAHSRDALTDWRAAHLDYMNRAAAVFLEDRTAQQMAADRINRENRRENGIITVTTTCHSSPSSFYPSVSTTCTTTED